MKKFVKYLVIFAKYHLQSLRNWSKSNKQAKVVWLLFIQISCAVKFEFNLELEMPSIHFFIKVNSLANLLLFEVHFAHYNPILLKWHISLTSDLNNEYLIHIYLYIASKHFDYDTYRNLNKKGKGSWYQLSFSPIAKQLKMFASKKKSLKDMLW